VFVLIVGLSGASAALCFFTEGSMATSDMKPDSNHREESYSGVNEGGLVVFILSMVVTFVMFIYVAFFSGGIDLKEIKPAEAPAAKVEAPAMPAAEVAPAVELKK
jgi:heme/copper-type cytochrome/quinol oxidase subunit 3